MLWGKNHVCLFVCLMFCELLLLTLRAMEKLKKGAEQKQGRHRDRNEQAASLEAHLFREWLLRVLV